MDVDMNMDMNVSTDTDTPWTGRDVDRHSEVTERRPRVSVYMFMYEYCRGYSTHNFQRLFSSLPADTFQYLSCYLRTQCNNFQR